METNPTESNTVLLTKKWKRNKIIWIYGLTSATILGIAHSVIPTLAAPETFNLHQGLSKLLTIVAASGLLGALTFLSKSPLPALPKEYEQNETTNIDGN